MSHPMGGGIGVTLRHCREKGNIYFKPVASCYQLFIKQLSAGTCMAVVL